MNTYVIPSDMKEAKDFCHKVCKSFNINISFDDKYGNFGNEMNQCACTCNIECSKFHDKDYDLLVFAVLHELGHMIGERKNTCLDIETSPNMKNRFCQEYAAWMWAINNYLIAFKQNISKKQAKYMMKCLNSYFKVKGTFWCPIIEDEAK